MADNFMAIESTCGKCGKEYLPYAYQSPECPHQIKGDLMMAEREEEIKYPEHKHPHSVENAQPNEYRIWVCEDCKHIFTDTEIRKDIENNQAVWGHDCKSHPHRKGQRCESHLESYIPDKLPTLNLIEEGEIEEAYIKSKPSVIDRNGNSNWEYEETFCQAQLDSCNKQLADIKMIKEAQNG